MGYIREPKNVDLLVAPSVLTEEAKHAISNAIAIYHKTGQIPESTGKASQVSFKSSPDTVQKVRTAYKNGKVTDKKKARI